MEDPTTEAAPSHRRRLLVALGGAVLLLLVAVAFGERHLKGALEHAISARTGRAVRIAGDLQVHLLAAQPSVSAREVSIGNPKWMPAGQTAEAGLVVMLLQWQWAWPPLEIRRLEIMDANLHLVRDAEGRANWHLHAEGPGKGPPLMHSLSMPDAQVELHDARRHLEFTGRVSAGDEPGQSGSPLRIEGAGQLNGRAASFVLLGDSLAEVQRDRPYHFTVAERSGAMRLRGEGALEHPFDFRQLHGTFAIHGPDMGDTYYLVGLKLPHTAAFELSGKLVRAGKRFEYTDLHASTGESDLSGHVTVERNAGRARIEAQLASKQLRLADLRGSDEGDSTAPAEPSAQKLKIPDTPLKVTALQTTDAVVTFRAGELDLARVALSDATGKMTLEKGVLSVTGLQASVAGGTLSGGARLDASHAVPRGSLDLLLAGAQLGELKSSPGAMGGLDGALSVRAQLSGTGASMHAMATTAEGTVTAVIPHGTVRAALPQAASLELAGALGLMTKSQKQTDVRCAVASFTAHEGVLTARTVIFDTDKALITMTGDAQIGTEALDFRLRGHPKTAALALHSAVAVQGTLAHPQFHLAGDQSAVQTGAAAALGVVLTPVAAVLAFVNPGLAHDADCQGLLSSEAAQTDTAPARH